MIVKMVDTRKSVSQQLLGILRAQMQQFSSKKSCEMTTPRLRIRAIYYAPEIHTIWKDCRRRGLHLSCLEHDQTVEQALLHPSQSCRKIATQSRARSQAKVHTSRRRTIQQSQSTTAEFRIRGKSSFQKIRLTIAGPEAKCLSQAFAKFLLKGRIILMCNSLLGMNPAFLFTLLIGIILYYTW